MLTIPSGEMVLGFAGILLIVLGTVYVLLHMQARDDDIMKEAVREIAAEFGLSESQLLPPLSSMSKPNDAFAAAVRKVFGRFASAQKIEALRLELIRIRWGDDQQAPYEVGPPISPLHS
jgi:hypothetical protein